MNYGKSASLSGPQLPKFKPQPITDDESEQQDDNNENVEIKSDDQPCCSKVNDEKPEGQITPDEKEMVEDCEHLRQLLVTKNEVLCNEIRKNFKDLSMGTQVTHYVELGDLETTTIQDIEPE